MCRLRLFYFENGEWGWAEWVIPYEEDIQAHIDFWSRGGKGRVASRMVTHEHIDLVQICKYMKQQHGEFQLIVVMKIAVSTHVTVRVACLTGCG